MDAVLVRAEEADAAGEHRTVLAAGERDVLVGERERAQQVGRHRRVPVARLPDLDEQVGDVRRALRRPEQLHAHAGARGRLRGGAREVGRVARRGGRRPPHTFAAGAHLRLLARAVRLSLSHRAVRRNMQAPWCGLPLLRSARPIQCRAASRVSEREDDHEAQHGPGAHHAPGSLPRPDDLADLLVRRAKGEPVDEAAFQERVREATEDVVARQVELGVDVVSDGEARKAHFIDYVRGRLTGFSPAPPMPEEEDSVKFSFFDDLEEFPDIVKATYSDTVFTNIVCTGEVGYSGQDDVQRDIANFKAALGGSDPDDAFFPAVTPGQMLFNFPNKYYPSDAAYLEAAAKAMAAEYKAIVRRRVQPASSTRPTLPCARTAGPATPAPPTSRPMCRWRSRR